MGNKLRLALLVNRDPTAKGVILTELRFFNTIFAGKEDDIEVYLVATSKHYMKIAMTIQKHFEFPTNLIMIENYEQRTVLSKFHAIITWTMACNFYGGAVSPRIVEVYNLISYFTNEVKRPVLIRLPDSEIQVMDYKKVIDVRKSVDEKGSFVEMNKEWIAVSEEVDYWDYDYCYWMANGRQDIFDWIVESVWDKIKEPYRVSTREKIIERSIYLSDDIFFMIRDHYEKFSHFPTITDSKEFGYVGFFTTLNKRRAVALTKIWKSNRHKIPIEIIGKGTDEIKIIGDYENVNIQERTVKGMDYWNYLNAHLAYIFVGKGNPTNRYINKTIYDCVCSRTPVVSYRPTDTNHVGMKSDELYFETEDELLAIYNKLLDPVERVRIIKDQHEDVFSRLSDAELDLSFIKRPDLEDISTEEYLKLYMTKTTHKENSAQSVF